MDDIGPEAVRVIKSNIKPLKHLAEGIALAEDIMNVLNEPFGQHNPDGPRIGRA